MPTFTTKTRQPSQQKRAKHHNKNTPTFTTKTRQTSQQKRANRHNAIDMEAVDLI